MPFIQLKGFHRRNNESERDLFTLLDTMLESDNDGLALVVFDSTRAEFFVLY